ncbi:hypothetical protein ACNKHO_00250 [Shigella flexneri]
MRNAGTRGIEADFLIATSNGGGPKPYQLLGSRPNDGDAELFKDALTFQLQRTVQCSLAAHGWQYGIWTLFSMILRTTSQ